MKFASMLVHPISHPSQYRTFKTLTQRWFGKMAITLRSELEIGQFFLIWVESIFASNQTQTQSVCPREEIQIRLIRHLTWSRDGALNFMLEIVEFLYGTPSVQLS
jgi:hypothetical protein